MPSKSSTRGPLHEALEAIPDGLKAEIVGGQLIVQSSPSYEHQTVAGNLSTFLTPRFRDGSGGPGGWIIVQDFSIYLPVAMQATYEREHVRPDVLGWRRDIMPVAPKGKGTAVAPQWVCEVLSPTTEAYDRNTKLPIYAALGVEWAWYIDPVDRYVEVLERTGLNWHRYAFTRGEPGRAFTALPPFVECILELASLWAGIEE